MIVLTHINTVKILGYVLAIGAVIVLPFATAPPASAATRHEVGIATSATLLRMNDAELSERMSEIRQLGAIWIRVDFSWRAIQPDNPRDYEWEEYDRLVRVAGVHNLKILAVINYTPSWAREPECAALITDEESAKKCIPRGAEEFGRFVRALAIRYEGTHVRGWEIWNEPNLTGHWKSAKNNNTLAVSPQEYASMANAAAAQIRHNYPDSVIVTGGLAPLFEPRATTGMRQSVYLAQLLPLLDAKNFDGIAIHPYSWPGMPQKAAVYNAFHTVDNGKPHMNLRTIMAQHGWGDKEIWGTEYGASTKGLRPMGIPWSQGRPDHVTEAMQANIVKQGVELWYKKENVGPLFVHSDSDQWLNTHNNEGGFGLKRVDGTKKPAYDALKEAAERVNLSQ